MSSQVEFAAVMVPENGQESWSYNGITGAQVGQFLTQNKAMLTDIDAYIDNDNTLKFVVAMEPGSETWWWWWGQTADQVDQLLAQNKAVLKKVSPYIDPADKTLKFAVIMTATGSASSWWWYPRLTGEQVGQFLTQNKAMLTAISAYIDTDATLKFAVIMAQGQGAWWWWWGQTGPQVGQLLTQNKARLAAVSAYLVSSENSITLNGNPNVSGLNGNATLTLLESGAYSFSGSWSPSNPFTGLIPQDVNFVMTLRDVRGTVWTFATSGTVPIEGTYSFNNHGTNPSLAANWQFLQLGYTARDQVNAGLDLPATWTAIVNWYNQNEQTIDGVVEVVGAIAGAVAS